MAKTDELLEKYSLTFDDLDVEERETYYAMVAAIQEKSLTVEKIKDFINHMLSSIQLELSKHDLNDKQDLFLKARLRNLSLLSAFMTSPDRAKAHLEKMLSNVSSAVG